ncbi:MAG: potassium/proton antiporter [Anaerolineae bacterium]|nr:potassium/proton antiporter [Anaerolineae bacterium]
MHTVLVFVSTLLIASIVASKLATRFGVPALLLFILIGIGIGSEGFGGIEFDNPALTQTTGVIALVFILFSGGMDTRWESIRPVLKEGLLLSTLGVGITALAVGWLAHTWLGFSWPAGILLGATMASTDAAAVFSMLRGKSVGLKGRLKPLLELESGSNDPMAVFLTLGMIQLITTPDAQLIDLAGMFVVQMGLGLLMGVLLGFLMPVVINRIQLEYDGLYPVLTTSFVLLSYGLTTIIGGNGFLAVYVTGVLLGRSNFIHRNSLFRFHDGLAWLVQITMFIVLGLQVFPSRLIHVAGTGLLMACFLIFVARPLAVFAVLAPTSLTRREKHLISWVGLRGAAPIILATFSQLAPIDVPVPIFDLVFFVVLVSVLLQGTTLVPVARWLGLHVAETPGNSLVTRMREEGYLDDHLLEIHIPANAGIIGKRLLDLTLPEGTLVVLIHRAGEPAIPEGNSILEAGDHLLLIAPGANHAALHTLFKLPAAPPEQG